jgi:S-DNA-T family DNA segregation ATPase FtsK/SpoIIIE
LIPVVTDPRKAAGALQWAVNEMTNRYKLFADNNVRDLRGYNVWAKEHEAEELPQIVIIIDELADLMMVAPHDVEDSICRLAQMARAAGMHLVIATQRPSVDVITGIIKANIPSRIAFAVSSYVDSKTILDMGGAEKLLGRGDMLYYPIGSSKPTRIQGAFVSDKEVEHIVSYVKGQNEVEYNQDVLEQIESAGERAVANEERGGDADELLPQAVEMAIDAGQASVAMYQRRLKVGYQRAARLIDQMETRKIIGPFDGTKPREVLITKAQWNEMFMNIDTEEDAPF